MRSVTVGPSFCNTTEFSWQTKIQSQKCSLMCVKFCLQTFRCVVQNLWETDRRQRCWTRRKLQPSVSDSHSSARTELWHSFAGWYIKLLMQFANRETSCTNSYWGMTISVCCWHTEILAISLHVFFSNPFWLRWIAKCMWSIWSSLFIPVSVEVTYVCKLIVTTLVHVYLITKFILHATFARAQWALWTGLFSSLGGSQM